MTGANRSPTGAYSGSRWRRCRVRSRRKMQPERQVIHFFRVLSLEPISVGCELKVDSGLERVKKLRGRRFGRLVDGYDLDLKQRSLAHSREAVGEDGSAPAAPSGASARLPQPARSRSRRDGRDLLCASYRMSVECPRCNGDLLVRLGVQAFPRMARRRGVS